jgi:UDP-N-acetylglucosamine 2-epimerase (non-hydrolysing)
MKELALIVGARPNFMKAAPLMEAIRAKGRMKARLIHTGQHFDANMSQIFFEQLDMPQPDLYLDIHGGSAAEQVGRVMVALSEEFTAHRPDMVVVFGDVNATLAAAMTANKMRIPLAHVEAGLRSFDREMPEEHNRVATDLVSDLLFTPSPDGDENLRNSGIAESRIFRVGNIMVDSLLRFRPAAEKLRTWEAYALRPKTYGLVTLHRPSNVDDDNALKGIVEALIQIQKETPLLFPVHPRTRERLERSRLLAEMEGAGMQVVEPIGYLEFLCLMTQAKFVLTDSGGIQEESTVLGVPCLTARENTERPITIEMGTNRLVGNSKAGILEAYKAMSGASGQLPELWDGHTAERIEAIIYEHLS